MPLYIKKYQQKVGLPPGALIHVGTERTEKSKIDVISYGENQFEEKTLGSFEEFKPDDDTTGVNWINVCGVHQTEIIESIGNHFQIHKLVQADIVNTQHRPKLEDFEDYLFIVIKMIYFNENEKIINEQISMIIGKNYVVSFQEIEGDVFSPIRARLRNSSGQIRKRGADYLAYTLIDTIVDNYFVVLERIGERIEDIEEKLLTNPTQDTSLEIHTLKRDLIMIRRSVWPLREVANILERGESKLIHKNTRIYLRDVYDHTIQVIDTIESSRDILSGMLDMYLSSVSNRMNNVMKVLTIIATIFMPLTFIAGIYGMNFQNMPELGWKYGYFGALVIMLVIAALMLIFFKRKNWL